MKSSKHIFHFLISLIFDLAPYTSAYIISITHCMIYIIIYTKTAQEITQYFLCRQPISIIYFSLSLKFQSPVRQVIHSVHRVIGFSHDIIEFCYLTGTEIVVDLGLYSTNDWSCVSELRSAAFSYVCLSKSKFPISFSR